MANTTRTHKGTTKGQDLECWASRYRLHDGAMEILRNTPGILTMAEALTIAKAKGYDKA